MAGRRPDCRLRRALRDEEAGRNASIERRNLPLDERLARYIIEGSRDGLIEDLELKRAEATPLDIINGPLMAGMDEVGRLLQRNEMIVAEVLQSAEAMKPRSRISNSSWRRPSSSRGRIVLATVKGDVHDIGKNLVEIILKNNGFKVVNLGIKVPPEDADQGVREHKPDAIGLSGLLVKSAQQMVTTAEGSVGSRHPLSDSRGWRGAVEPFHAPSHRARVHGLGRVRERCDDRSRAGQAPARRAVPRCALERARNRDAQDGGLRRAEEGACSRSSLE